MAKLIQNLSDQMIVSVLGLRYLSATKFLIKTVTVEMFLLLNFPFTRPYVQNKRLTIWVLAVYFKCNDPHILLLYKTNYKLFIRNTFKIIIIETIPKNYINDLNYVLHIISDAFYFSIH